MNGNWKFFEGFEKIFRRGGVYGWGEKRNGGGAGAIRGKVGIFAGPQEPSGRMDSRFESILPDGGRSPHRRRESSGPGKAKILAFPGPEDSLLLSCSLLGHVCKLCIFRSPGQIDRSDRTVSLFCYNYFRNIRHIRIFIIIIITV
ncbi:hypothetical protein H171_3576 [[Clostridium] celerecrescens 18A]|uniref:Uncharacterized protein n=1 Tax=[Clostridium] celerecrescens 18A TaxID=1286362 RepID=A0A2M8Z972_9FIRM|nr:hypothetical protein H171_3576 [[Clostridium] celerecrescens 18A]